MLTSLTPTTNFMDPLAVPGVATTGAVYSGLANATQGHDGSSNSTKAKKLMMRLLQCEYNQNTME